MHVEVAQARAECGGKARGQQVEKLQRGIGQQRWQASSRGLARIAVPRYAVAELHNCINGICGHLVAHARGEQLLEGKVKPDGGNEAAGGGERGSDAPLAHYALPLLQLGLGRVGGQLVRERDARTVLAHHLFTELLLHLIVELLDERCPQEVGLRHKARARRVQMGARRYRLWWV